MMKRSVRSVSIGVTVTLVLGMFATLSSGCDTIDANGFFGLEPCDIFNCNGLFFGNLAADHNQVVEEAGHDDEGA